MKQTRISAFALLLIAVAYTANAQIKVVGDDYSQSLSAKDYYSQDVGFETYFPSVDPIQYLGYLSINPDKTISLLGDTVWLGVSYGVGLSDNFAVCNGKILDTIPSGYYVISGYIFGRENAKEVFRSKEKSQPSERIGTEEKLKQTILDYPTPSERDRREAVKMYFGYMKLSSVDTTKGIIEAYYRPGANDDLERFFYPYNNIISLRFYNEIQNKLMNKEVALVSNKTYLCDREVEIRFDDYKNMKYSICDAVSIGKVIKNDMTNEDVQLKDDRYIVKDVVIKIDGNKVGLYCVLYGDNTGTFARKVQYTSYKYTYSATVNDKKYSGGSKYSDMPFTSRDGWGGELSIVPVEHIQKLAPLFADSIATKVKIDAMNAAEQERIRKENELYWQQLQAKQAAERRQQMIAKYGTKFGELVAKKQVALDMTKAMCRDAWGSPMDTYRTTTKFGQSEVWRYNYKTRVYFYNGKVVMIDN